MHASSGRSEFQPVVLASQRQQLPVLKAEKALQDFWLSSFFPALSGKPNHAGQNQCSLVHKELLAQSGLCRLTLHLSASCLTFAVHAGQKQRSLVHKAKETLQDWQPQLGDPAEDGEAFWLPGGSLLELTMQVLRCTLTLGTKDGSFADPDCAQSAVVQIVGSPA